MIFQERGIRGAILPEKVVERNSIAALRTLIHCRGLISDSHATLVRKKYNATLTERC